MLRLLVPRLPQRTAAYHGIASRASAPSAASVRPASLQRLPLFRGACRCASAAAGAPPASSPPPGEGGDVLQRQPVASPSAVPGVLGGGGDLLIAMFTCKVCDTRTARTISKAAYTGGTVLVRCPGCLGLHMLADHLGFVDDASVTAEELLRAKGEAVRSGRLGAGDADENAISLTAADLTVLRTRHKSVKLSDGSEPPVVAAQGILRGGGAGAGDGAGHKDTTW